ncbi:MAG TPA: hypothetical protein VMT46_16575 [Anaerolineaceae bacterium]|nr:hypothetical protein [Anaerolineaceae bacterium]
MNETKDSPVPQTEIKIRGYLDPRWQEWFDPLALHYDPETNITTLTGSLPDQAALLGILNKFNQMNIPLITVTQA